MSSSTVSRFVFRGTKSTEAEVAYLRGMGFVHVTGLSARVSKGNSYVIGADLPPKSKGNAARNNGFTALVTEGGEVWLYCGESDVISQNHLNQGDVFVPCSNAEQISTRDLLMRMADPYAGLACE
jgi:hypothetical protein